jgi:hypothetical protein
VTEQLVRAFPSWLLPNRPVTRVRTRTLAFGRGCPSQHTRVLLYDQAAAAPSSEKKPALCESVISESQSEVLHQPVCAQARGRRWPAKLPSSQRSLGSVRPARSKL